VIGLALAFVVLGAVRPNAALTVSLACLPFVITRLGIIRGLTISALLFAAFMGIVSLTSDARSLFASLIDLENQLAIVQSNFADSFGIGESGLKLAVGQALLPTSIWQLVIFSPLRPPIWFFSPYPFIILDLGLLASLPAMLRENPIEYFRSFSDPAAIIS